MKRQDLALIIIVIAVSAVLSTFASKTLFAPAKNKQLSAEVVDPITTEFNKPDSRYFNSDSINPTKLIQIGDGSNPQPF